MDMALMKTTRTIITIIVAVTFGRRRPNLSWRMTAERVQCFWLLFESWLSEMQTLLKAGEVFTIIEGKQIKWRENDSRCAQPSDGQVTIGKSDNASHTVSDNDPTIPDSSALLTESRQLSETTEATYEIGSNHWAELAAISSTTKCLGDRYSILCLDGARRHHPCGKPKLNINLCRTGVCCHVHSAQLC